MARGVHLKIIIFRTDYAILNQFFGSRSTYDRDSKYYFIFEHFEFLMFQIEVSKVPAPIW